MAVILTTVALTATGCASLAPYDWDTETKIPEKPVPPTEPSPFVDETPTPANPVENPLPSDVAPQDDALLPPPPPAPPVQPEGVSAGEPDWRNCLTLDQVLQYTIKCHPLLRMRRFEIGAAQGRLITAGLLPNPEFVMQTETPTEEPGPTRMMTRLMFTIPTGPKLHVAKEAARADICRTQWDLSNETQVVLIAAATAALDLQYLQELAALQEHLANLASQQADLQAESFQLGGVTYANRMTTALDATTAELSSLNIKTQLEVARIGLSRAMGLTIPVQPKMQGMTPVVPAAVIPLEKLMEESRRVRPDLAAASASLRKSQEDVRINRWKAVPDLEIGARSIDSMSSRPGDGAGFRMRVAVPIFDRNQGGIAESKAIVGVQAATLDNVQINSLSDVATTYVELLALQTQLQYYDQNVAPMISQTEAQIVEMFRDRAVPAYQVAQMLQQFSSVRLKQLELRYRYNQRRMQLEILLGRSLAAKTLDQIAPPPVASPSEFPGVPSVPPMFDTVTPPANLLPGDNPPNTTLPGKNLPADLGPGSLGPDEIGPGNAAPADALPGDATPGNILPGDVLPGDAAPLDAAPDKLPQDEPKSPLDSLMEDPLGSHKPALPHLVPPPGLMPEDSGGDPGIAVAEDPPTSRVIPASATEK